MRVDRNWAGLTKCTTKLSATSGSVYSTFSPSPPLVFVTVSSRVRLCRAFTVNISDNKPVLQLTISPFALPVSPLATRGLQMGQPPCCTFWYVESCMRIQLRIISLLATCSFAERAVCCASLASKSHVTVYITNSLYRASSLTTTSGIAPARPKCLALY